MAETSSHETTEHTTERQSSTAQDSDRAFGDGLGGWLADSTIRAGLALIGLIILLFALGAAAGFDLLGLAVDAVSSEVGRWLVVAFIALVIIAIAARGFDTDED